MTFESLMRLSQGYLAHGDLVAAMGAAEAAVALAPKQPTGWAALGVVLAKQDRHERAVACFEAAVALDPKDVASFTCMGELLIELGAYTQACSALENACRLDPKAQHPMGRRARALIAKTLATLKSK